MPSVELRFSAPDDKDLAKLHIFEALAASGPFAEIEAVTAIGSYPNYISEYTTSLATSPFDWFTIKWEDAKGALSPASVAIQGGQETLVGKLIKRVLERDPALSILIAKQEAESVIQRYYGDDVDPYDPTLTASYRVLNGLTYLILAHAVLARTVLGQLGSSVTIGLVSVKQGSQVKLDVTELLELANSELNWNTTAVLELAALDKRYGAPIGRTWMEAFSEIPWVIVR